MTLLFFFKLMLPAWNRTPQVLVTLIGVVNVAVILGLMNTIASSGRVTMIAQVNQTAPVDGGVVTNVPVMAITPVSTSDLLLEIDACPEQYSAEGAEAAEEVARLKLKRQETVSERTASVSKQAVDPPRTTLDQAQARLDPAN